VASNTQSQQADRALIKAQQVALLAVAALILLMQGMTQQKFRDLMAVDKKVLDGALRLILLKGPLGSCVFTAHQFLSSVICIARLLPEACCSNKRYTAALCFSMDSATLCPQGSKLAYTSGITA